MYEFIKTQRYLPFYWLWYNWWCLQTPVLFACGITQSSPTYIYHPSHSFHIEFFTNSLTGTLTTFSPCFSFFHPKTSSYLLHASFIQIASSDSNSSSSHNWNLSGLIFRLRETTYKFLSRLNKKHQIFRRWKWWVSIHIWVSTSALILKFAIKYKVVLLPAQFRISVLLIVYRYLQ